MVRSFRWNGRKRYETGSSWERHDHTRRQSSNTARKASLATLSRKLGINPNTVAQWRKKATAEDLKTGPKAHHSTTLTQAEEAMVVAFRRHQTQNRYIEAAVNGVIIGGLYLPNGNPRPGPEFGHPLAWFDKLIAHAETLLESGLPVVLAGDFNVMPTEADVYRPERWTKDALFAPEVRALYARLIDQGWTDSLRTRHPDETIYTFWDYFRNAYGRDAGFRIDHLPLSPLLADGLVDAQVDRHVRGWEKTSDHAPTWIRLATEQPSKKRSRSSRRNKDGQ